MFRIIKDGAGIGLTENLKRLCKGDDFTFFLVHTDSSGFKPPYYFMPKFLLFFHIGQDHIVIIHVMTGTVNKKKCKIIPLTKPFRFCKAKFTLTETGKIKVNGNRDGVKRARRKLKLFHREFKEG